MDALICVFLALSIWWGLRGLLPSTLTCVLATVFVASPVITSPVAGPKLFALHKRWGLQFVTPPIHHKSVELCLDAHS